MAGTKRAQAFQNKKKKNKEAAPTKNPRLESISHTPSNQQRVASPPSDVEKVVDLTGSKSLSPDCPESSDQGAAFDAPSQIRIPAGVNIRLENTAHNMIHHLCKHQRRFADPKVEKPEDKLLRASRTNFRQSLDIHQATLDLVGSKRKLETDLDAVASQLTQTEEERREAEEQLRAAQEQLRLADAQIEKLKTELRAADEAKLEQEKSHADAVAGLRTKAIKAIVRTGVLQYTRGQYDLSKELNQPWVDELGNPAKAPLDQVCDMDLFSDIPHPSIMKFYEAKKSSYYASDEESDDDAPASDDEEVPLEQHPEVRVADPTENNPPILSTDQDELFAIADSAANLDQSQLPPSDPADIPLETAADSSHVQSDIAAV